MARILIIEDEPDVADFIGTVLRQIGYDVEVALPGGLGLQAARSQPADLVVLDLMLPDMDGIDICRELRREGDTGIVILTARGLVGERIRGLEAGADDYLAKPFAFDELLARIRSVLRRRSASQEGVVTIGDLSVDTIRREVRRGERLINLTTREFELLKLLAQNAGRPLQRELIIQRIWGDDFESDTDPLKVYINFLRRKLNQAEEPDLIHTLPGFGYVLKEPQS